MIKKKGTSQVTAKKKTGKRNPSKKKLDPAQVREELAVLVKSEAKEITEAVMDQAMHGALAPAKYLLEMAGVFPPLNDGEQATEEEDCLAKTLLDRLNVSRKPNHDKEDDEDEEKVKDSSAIEVKPGKTDQEVS
jgi:hypothetical protein